MEEEEENAHTLPPAPATVSPSISRKISIHQLVEADRAQNIPAVLQRTPALINSHNKEGYTPLHTACLKGLEECVQVLLQVGMNQSPKIEINAKDSTGWSPLHCASLNGHLACVELLIQNNADVNAVTNNGSTALHYAASWYVEFSCFVCVGSSLMGC